MITRRRFVQGVLALPIIGSLLGVTVSKVIEKEIFSPTSHPMRWVTISHVPFSNEYGETFMELAVYTDQDLKDLIHTERFKDEIELAPNTVIAKVEMSSDARLNKACDILIEGGKLHDRDGFNRGH